MLSAPDVRCGAVISDRAAHDFLTARAILLALGVVILALRPALAAPEVSEPVEASGKKLVTPEAQLAIDRGLAFLASQQDPALGSFGSGLDFRRNVAITSLCAMAFLSAGHTPGRGEYGDVVQRAVDFILSRCEPNGFIVERSSMSHGPMYGHGFSTMFLAEVFGMAPNPELKNKLGQAVRLIVNTQNDEGGWRYQPERVQHADISVTVCQIMALRAARNSGLYVPKSVIDRSVDYVKKSQNADGGFRYQLVRPEQSEFPRSAAAIVALYSAGIYDGDDIENGLDYLVRFAQRPFRFETQFYYGHYYAVQAMWHAGGEHWMNWYPAIRDDLLQRQLPTGSWSDNFNGNEYATGMSCLILQMPNNYLPIFQR